VYEYNSYRRKDSLYGIKYSRMFRSSKPISRQILIWGKIKILLIFVNSVKTYGTFCIHLKCLSIANSLYIHISVLPSRYILKFLLIVFMSRVCFLKYFVYKYTCSCFTCTLTHPLQRYILIKDKYDLWFNILSILAMQFPYTQIAPL